MVENSGDSDSIDLSEAIEALRSALETAWRRGLGCPVRFKLEPVELTVQAGITRTGKGAAGIKWHVLALGGERSRETEGTQTLKLRLAPQLFDTQGNPLAETEQLILDQDVESGTGTDGAPLHEPE